MLRRARWGGNAKNPSCDLAGNLTDDGENYLFTYDCRNRIIEVKRKGDSSLKAKYEYDGLRRRVRAVVYDSNGTTELSDTWFLYDGWRCLEERDHNDSNELRASRGPCRPRKGGLGERGVPSRVTGPGRNQEERSGPPEGEALWGVRTLSGRRMWGGLYLMKPDL